MGWGVDVNVHVKYLWYRCYIVTWGGGGDVNLHVRYLRYRCYVVTWGGGVMVTFMSSTFGIDATL